MTIKPIGLTCLGLFVGSLIGALAGFDCVMRHNAPGNNLEPVYLGSALGAILFGMLTPLTSGRVLKILNPAIIRGERLEKSSMRKDWKWGVGGLGTLIGMFAFEAPIAFAKDVGRGLSDKETIEYILVGIILCVLFLFCFADIVPAVWAITLGLLGWITAFTAAGLMAFDIKVGLGLCHLGLGLFATFAALGMLVGLLRGKRPKCEPSDALRP